MAWIALILTQWLLIGVGGALIVVGLIPQRTGREPHCRKCGYNLTGRDLQDEAARCSECGTGLTARTVRIGQRRRRVPWLVTSISFLLLGSALHFPANILLTGRFNIYQHLPTWCVLDLMQSRNLTVARFAQDEVLLRLLSDELSQDEMKRVGRIALRVLQQKQHSLAGGCYKILLMPDVRDLLSQSDWQQLLAGCTRNRQLITRRIVPAGVEFPLRHYGYILLPQDCSLRYRHNGVYANGSLVQAPRSIPGGGASAGPAAFEWRIRIPQPGEYDLEVHLEEALTWENRFQKIELARNALVLQTTCTVLASSEPGVRLSRSPEVDDAMTAGMLLKRFHVASTNWGRELVIQFATAVPPSLPVAFDVFASINEEMLRVGSFSLQADANRSVSFHFRALEGEISSPADLWLIASPRAACETVGYSRDLERFPHFQGRPAECSGAGIS